jgi:hypothetical protein
MRSAPSTVSGETTSASNPGSTAIPVGSSSVRISNSRSYSSASGCISAIRSAFRSANGRTGRSICLVFGASDSEVRPTVRSPSDNARRKRARWPSWTGSKVPPSATFMCADTASQG